MTDDRESVVVASRPTPGDPRPYHFPPFERGGLANGLTVLDRSICRAGRSSRAQLVLPNGAVDEPALEAGATVLAARALTEGTERLRRDRARRGDRAARCLAPRRRGLGRVRRSASRCRPSRLAPALELLAEVVAQPDVPGVRGRAAPRRAPRTTSSRRGPMPAAVPTRRSSPRSTGRLALPPSVGGTRATVAPLDRAALERAWRAWPRLRPGRRWSWPATSRGSIRWAWPIG